MPALRNAVVLRFFIIRKRAAQETTSPAARHQPKSLFGLAFARAQSRRLACRRAAVAAGVFKSRLARQSSAVRLPDEWPPNGLCQPHQGCDLGASDDAFIQATEDKLNDRPR